MGSSPKSQFWGTKWRKIQTAISSDLCIRLTWNLTGTSWVVSYGDKTIPRWRTAAILKIDISPYLSVKSSHDVIKKWKSCIGQTPSSTERISCSKTITTLLPSAKCTRPLFQGRTGCGGRPSGWHDIVTCQRLVLVYVCSCFKFMNMNLNLWISDAEYLWNCTRQIHSYHGILIQKLILIHAPLNDVGLIWNDLEWQSRLELEIWVAINVT